MPIAIAAVVLVVAAVIATGVLTNWFGLAADESVWVLEQQTITNTYDGTSDTVVTQYERDENGSLTSVNTSQNGYTESMSVTTDEDGVVLSASYTSPDGPSQNIMVSNTPTKDSSGRVTSIDFAINGELYARADIEYYGADNHISAITYTNAWGAPMSAVDFSALAMGANAPFLGYAASAFIGSDNGQCRLQFNEDGGMASYTTPDGETVPMPTMSPEGRSSQTINVGNAELTYDENGNLLRQVTSFDNETTVTYDYTYVEIEHPSSWVAATARLYS